MIRLLAPVLFLALSLAALGQDPSIARSDVVRIEVLRGRAVVHTEGRPDQTLLRDRRAIVEGPAHMEVGAGAEARLSWAGRASLHLWGPASIQWRSMPADERSGADLPTYSQDRLEWRLFDLTWADLEVRRGSHVLWLPGDWRMDCDSGAWRVRSLPTGPMELRHHAGSPATLTWLGDASRARPPITLYSGSSLRIDRPQPSAKDQSDESARAWPRSSWPWRQAADTPQQRTQRALRGERTAESRRQEYRGGRRVEHLPDTSASVPVTPEPPVVTVERRILPRPTSGTEQPAQRNPDQGGPASRRLQHEAPSQTKAPSKGPVARRVVPAPAPTARREPSVEPPVASPQPVPTADAPYAFEQRHWRGLSRSQLDAVGPLAVQKTTGVEVRVYPGGRLKVLVDALSRDGVWCFGPDADYLVAPGAVAVFEADGSLGMRLGDVHEETAVPGRPSPSRLQ